MLIFYFLHHFVKATRQCFLTTSFSNQMQRSFRYSFLNIPQYALKLLRLWTTTIFNLKKCRSQFSY
jgi:hypothetical protein